MANEYLVNVAACTDFSCTGFSTFEAYLTAQGITFTTVDNIKYFDLTKLKYIRGLSTTGLATVTNYSGRFKIGDSTSSTNIDLCPASISSRTTVIGKVKIPFFNGTAVTNQLEILLPGTLPLFSTKETINTSTYYRYVSFTEGIGHPLRANVLLQGSGGGGSGRFDSIANYPGYGGGGGGFVCITIDLTAPNNYSFTIPTSGGAGGKDGNRSSTTGGNGSAAILYYGSSTAASAGGGGGASFVSEREGHGSGGTNTINLAMQTHANIAGRSGSNDTSHYFSSALNITLEGNTTKNNFTSDAITYTLAAQSVASGYLIKQGDNSAGGDFGSKGGDSRSGKGAYCVDGTYTNADHYPAGTGGGGAGGINRHFDIESADNRNGTAGGAGYAYLYH